MVAVGNRLTQDAKYIACFGRLDSPEISAQIKQKMEELAQGRILSQDAIQDLKQFLEAGQVQTNDKSAAHQCATHVCVSTKPVTTQNCWCSSCVRLYVHGLDRVDV